MSISAESDTRTSRRWLIIILCLATMMLLKGGASTIYRRGHRLTGVITRSRDIIVDFICVIIRAKSGMLFLESTVRAHASRQNTTAAIVHLVIVQGRVAGHGVVLTQTSLTSAYDNIEGDGSDVRDISQDSEGEQCLVYPANGDTGRSSPVCGVAGSQDRMRHAPAQ